MDPLVTIEKMNNLVLKFFDAYLKGEGNLLAPYTEEPWLEERYGEEYRQYKREVPRFIGRRHSKAA